MKTLATVLFFSSLFFTTPIMAGSGHDHGHSHAQEAISSEEAVNRASKKLKQLADTGKIDTAWVGIKASHVEKKTFSRDTEWVITFKNDKISDSSKKTLYLFFSLDGHYIATNYTGN